MNIKKLISYLVAFVIAIGIIFFISPFYDLYKENKKYDFTLSSLNGEVSKSSLEGKAFAVYFGYMYCPDVCPTSLAQLSEALKSFPKEKAKNFTGLFISVDPQRDKPKALQEYAQYFHPTFVGATSNKKNIDDIVKRYKAYYKLIKLEDSAMDYSVTHTSYFYIFDKDGNFVQKVDHHLNPDDIKKVLAKVL